MTIGLTVCFLWCSTNIMENKSNTSKYADFYNQDADFDILFLGTSHIGYGVYPMELWNDYGIVSYNLAGHGNPLATTYWILENALEYTSPKLVVVDCYLLSCMSKTNSQFESVHYSLDAFPNSKLKINAVFDLLDDEYAAQTFLTAESENSRTPMELLWHYTIYHNRWNDLGENDFAPSSTPEKGAEHIIAIMPSQKSEMISTETKMDEDTISVEYLKKIIEDCQSRGIDVLLTYIPFTIEESYQKEANSVYDIAEYYGINYINFLNTDFINYETDYCDINHLNPSGARKLTDYLGQYITEHYDIPDQKSNELYADWYADYADYTNYKAENLRGLESLDKYLMLLADKNYSILVGIGNDQFWDNEYHMSLLENLHVDKNMISEDTDFLVIQEAGKHVDYLENFYASGGSAITSLGEITMSAGNDIEGYRITLDGKELCSIAQEQNSNTDIQIIVIDTNSAEVVDNAAFTFQNKFSK